MLIDFKVTNFRSIRETQTLSLVASKADKDLPSCVINSDLPGMSGVHYLKGAALYGANASGKSNIIKAMNFVKYFVRRSATKFEPGDPTGAEPFKLDSQPKNKPSAFELTFVADGQRYVFGFSVNSKRVVEEYLVAYPKGSPQKWYSRTYNETTEQYDWTGRSPGFKQDRILQERTRENALFLSVGAQFNHPKLELVFNWFKNNLQIINLSVDGLVDPGFSMKLVSEPSHHDRIVRLLQNADIGVVDAKIEEGPVDKELLKKSLPPAMFSKIESKVDGNQFLQTEVSLFHKAGDAAPVLLDFDDEESAGTRRFFALAGPWIDILDNSRTVFIDEIETSLHPILVKELLKLIFCDENNKMGSQVIFATHNPILLDGSLLRRDQVWFTEKSPEGATHLYPLTDFQPRKDEALAKGYLSGRYGAIPYLPEGLKL